MVKVLCCPRPFECKFNFVVSGNLGNHHRPALGCSSVQGTDGDHVGHWDYISTCEVLTHSTWYITAAVPGYAVTPWESEERHYKACRPSGVLRKKILGGSPVSDVLLCGDALAGGSNG